MAFPNSCRGLPLALSNVWDYFKFGLLDCGIRLKVCVDNMVRAAPVSTASHSLLNSTELMLLAVTSSFTVINV